MLGPDSPCHFPKHRTRDYMSRGDKDAFGGKLQELDRMAVKNSHAAPRAMVVVDAPDDREAFIFVRGDPSRAGEPVPRRFLRIIEGDARKPFTQGSGRLDLARAITAPGNMLTSRVIVNRIWMHHFGEPLVDTPNDFGTRCDPPQHRELLDYLAQRFQRDGWSVKNLHRLLMLSSTYQQASLDRFECRSADPENRLYWRMNRRRLDLEAMRDTLLSVARRLDREMGGRPVDLGSATGNRRRTVYGLVDRQSLPGLYRAFDFASPDQSAERRPHTTTPQQALFAMNSPFIREQAQSLIERPEVTAASNPAQRVDVLYRLLFSRSPTAGETQVALDFVGVAAADSVRSMDIWQQYAQVLLVSNEMMFAD